MSQDNLLELIYKETQNIKEQQSITNRRLDAMDERFDAIDRRLDAMDERFDGIDRRLDAMDERFDGIDRRLDAMDERFDGIDRHLDAMDKRFEAMDDRFDAMDKQFADLSSQVAGNTARIEAIERRIEDEICPSLRRIELSIENEIRPNIMRVAEAHLDLNRKLDEALKSDREREKVVLRLNFLDGEVRRLNERVNSMA